MSFWKNVEKELDYQGISRKELAIKIGMSYNNIGNGIKRDAMPGADTALKISRVLGVSIDYLLSENSIENQEKLFKNDTTLLQKYKRLINNLEKLTPETREPIIEMINRLSRT